MLQIPIPAGVVDCSDFHQALFLKAASAELDLFLSEDLKNSRLFLLKIFWFFIQLKMKGNP
jgi:hypothetical protein